MNKGFTTKHNMIRWPYRQQNLLELILERNIHQYGIESQENCTRRNLAEIMTATGNYITKLKRCQNDLPNLNHNLKGSKKDLHHSRYNDCNLIGSCIFIVRLVCLCVIAFKICLFYRLSAYGGKSSKRVSVYEKPTRIPRNETRI